MRVNAAAALDPIPYHREDETMNEVDQRIIAAREYLAVAQQRDVLHLPPSALLRECAESRRQLAAVLDAFDGAVLAVVAGRADEAGRLARIRQVLAEFDWEFHDRQLALEAIDRIAAGGER